MKKSVSAVKYALSPRSLQSSDVLVPQQVSSVYIAKQRHWSIHISRSPQVLLMRYRFQSSGFYSKDES
eukprot:211455-Amphidinium_carterae.1